MPRDDSKLDAPDNMDSLLGNSSRAVTDAIRRMVMGGVGTLLTTEEGARAALGELKLPKEVAHYLVGQVEKTKQEVVGALRRELRGFLETVDAQKLVNRTLMGLTIEVKAEVTFKPNKNGGVDPQVKVHHAGPKKPPVKRKPKKASSR